MASLVCTYLLRINLLNLHQYIQESILPEVTELLSYPVFKGAAHVKDLALINIFQFKACFRATSSEKKAQLFRPKNCLRK